MCQLSKCRENGGLTNVFLLFMNVSNLEPDVFLIQWTRWISDDVFKALERSVLRLAIDRCRTCLQTLLKFLLLLIDYAKSEVDLVGFLKVWLHAHYL